MKYNIIILLYVGAWFSHFEHLEVNSYLADPDMLIYASFSPDVKKIVTASYGGTEKAWDVGSGKLLMGIKNS
jgi:hypothetical protein